MPISEVVVADTGFVLFVLHLFFLDGRLPHHLLPVVLGLVLGDYLKGKTLIELATIAEILELGR